MLNIKAVRPEVVTLVASAVLLALFNYSLWQHLLKITQISGGLGLRMVFLSLVLLIFNLVLSVLSSRWTLKPLLIALFMISAGVAYFMNEYGVLIDAGMFRNVAETDVSEVHGLLSLKLAAYILGLGVVPSALLWIAPVSYRSLLRSALSKLLVVVVSALMIGGLALSNYQGLSSLFRNHKELRMLVVPSNVVGASISYLREQLASAQHPFRQIGLDARQASAWTGHSRKSLTVLVIGESARAENFGILGYPKDTTPELSRQQGLVAYTDVHSCGTETAVSVPCMFSNMPRKDYNPTLAANQEGLLDILQRAGLDVIWLDNQSGCKGTCSRVVSSDLSKERDPALCATGECHDEILLRDLPALLDNLQRDTVLVLHQMGSHGPEYYKRVPAGHDHFQPVCQSNALNTCSQEQIVNAYDNTIRYTDHVLGRLIDTLRSHESSVDTAMYYVSDHGESLGEYNLFLHGTPYMLAPEQQKHVGMFTWFSEGYQQDFGVDNQCLQASRSRPLSHDNLFHSMIGLLQVETGEYQRDLDLFAQCRR